MKGVILRTTAGLSLLLGPVLLWQGRRVRGVVPRLPEADGPRAGLVDGGGTPLSVLLFGESTAAGVGAATHSEALAGQLAVAVANKTKRTVKWQVIGQSGATAHDALTLFKAKPPEKYPDLVVLVLGVNDVLQMTSAKRWRRNLYALIQTVREHHGPVPVVIAAVPPVGCFPALPQPLRGVLGLRAALLDNTARCLAQELKDVVHAPFPALTHDKESELFCGDRFHPSPAGYTLWGQALAEHIAPPAQPNLNEQTPTYREIEK